MLPQMNGRLSVAIVGTRKMSDYGKRMTFEIARDLARAGAVVVSGMALGIDGVANAAAINGGGETVAVLGSGIDVIYPSAHAKLAEFITRHGAVITEFPPGTRPEGRNFPIRNRIISGLAQATAVIEGDLRSGSLITARRALQQDRVVYAMPGRVDEAGSEGPCMLLRNGAKLLLAADDILADFEKVYSDKINIFKLLERSPFVIDKVLRSMSVYSKSERKPRPTEAASRAPEPPAEAPPQTAPTPEEEAKLREQLAEIGGRAEELYRLLPPEGGISCDDVAEAGIPISEVMVLAAQMELYGLLEILPGGQMKRKKTQ
jgi:DNA processing protein